MSLTRDFLALSTHAYRQWEQFREHLMLPLKGLLEEYAPAFFTRIGLRYQNVIQRSVLGLDAVDWSELLQPYIAGELARPELSGSIEGAIRTTLVRLGSGSVHVRLAHGLGELKDTEETCYLIDSDFYTERRMEPDDATQTLDHFNSQAGHLFRWCITDRLHTAMEPRALH